MHRTALSFTHYAVFLHEVAVLGLYLENRRRRPISGLYLLTSCDMPTKTIWMSTWSELYAIPPWKGSKLTVL